MQVEELLSGLTEAQRRAVTHPAGPLAVQAGAGSGKTRVLTRRIAYRALTDDIDPRHVMALTFTRKAAGELASRLRAFGLRDAVTVGTFHAVAYGQLRQRWADRGLDPPELLPAKTSLVARVVGDRKVSPAEVAGEVEWAKARLVGPAQYAARARAEGRRTSAPAATIAELYAAYEEEKRRRRLVDFDDLLRLCRFDLLDDADFASVQRWRHRHFFVDEFQDVNPLQFALLQAWLGERDDVCVVGDANQAIYGWNGADAGHLVDFHVHYPGASTIVLDENHRSTPEVLAVAAAVLPDEEAGPARAAPTTSSEGPVPSVHAYPDEAAEAAGIARAARDLHQPGASWSRQAVLVRTHSQLAVLEEAFRAAGIPHRVRGRTDLSRSAAAEELLRRLAASTGSFATALADLRQELAGATPDLDLPAVMALLAAADDYAATDPDATADGFRLWLQDRGGDDRGRTVDAVELCTFHAAKGLEWPVVHLAGLEQGLVPIAHARTTAARAEERRLLYVAVTRAEHVLRLSWAARRTFGARTVEREPSMFLADIERTIDDLAARAVPADRRATARFLAEQRSRLGPEPDPGPPADPVDAAPPDAPVEAAATHGPPRLRAIEGSRGRPARDAERRPADGVPPLEQALEEWRRTMARAARVSPQAVFPDRTLAAVARTRPRSVEELEAIPGIGPVKVRRYGDALLDLLARHPAG